MFKRKLIKKVIYYLCLLISTNVGFSQNLNPYDSLLLKLSVAKEDTTKLDLLVALSEGRTGYDTNFCNQALILANKLYLSPDKKIKLKVNKSIAKTYENLADYYDLLGDKIKGEFYLKQALTICEKTRDKKLLADYYAYASLFYSDNDKILDLLNKSLKLAEEIGDKKRIASLKINLGYIYGEQGKIYKQLEYYTISLGIYKNLKNDYDIIETLTLLSVLYNDIGEFKTALDYNDEILKIASRLKDKSIISSALKNTGNIFLKQNKNTLALKYHLKSLIILKEFLNAKIKNNEIDEIEYNSNIVSNLLAIGNSYKSLKDFSNSLKYYELALEIEKEISIKWNYNTNIQRDLSICYDRIGSVYESQSEYKKALIQYHKSLDIKKQIDHEYYEIDVPYFNLARVYRLIGNYPKAIDFAIKALKLAQKTKKPANISNYAKLLSEIYRDKNDFKNSLKNYELYIKIRDSLNNKETQRLALSHQFIFEYEKKVVADSIKAADERKIINTQLRQETTERYALYGGLIIVLTFTGFVFNRFKLSQKQKKIITEQKWEVEKQKDVVEEQNHLIKEKQKEILDSIHYAKRLQEAILPPLTFIDEHVPNNFVLYQPKDVVAGDFYWAETKDNKFFIAAADCTGHGVPGAMVSVVCSNALNRTVNEFGITETGKILDKTRELVLETFAKGNAEVKDGMDISLLCIDKENNKAFWSGANNPLWYVQSSDTSIFTNTTVTSSEVEKSTDAGLDFARPDIQLIEIKADKQPIGKTDYAKPFTTHEIDLQEGMLFYLFTDGFADQFGGPKGKKFKYKQLEELLLANANKSMNEQHEVLIQQFSLWKGDLEQVDDVCVIGVRV